ncbi:peptidase M75, partial [Streptomyces sp. SID11233]|nr:peptidase M75 [Streptomyces sp. SID11233]
ITPTSMANGAKDLLDEVATGKVTGEEERYSHTDLVDFKANVEGAEKAYTLLKPVAKAHDAALTGQLDA